MLTARTEPESGEEAMLRQESALQLENLVDPRGDVLKPTHQSPKPERLEGITLGLLDNTKWNAAHLLRSVARRIDEAYGLGAVLEFSKPSWGQPAEPGLCDEIASSCHAVITASGD